MTLYSDTEEKKSLNKVNIFVSFMHKKYSFRKLSDLIKNILICVSKLDEGLTKVVSNSIPGGPQLCTVLLQP